AWLKSRFPQEEVLPAPAGERSLVHQAAGQLDEYLAGRRRSFDLALDLNGTAFQKKVWQTLLALPYGTTISYSALAARAGFPGAARAVGTAMRANPLAIVVPCHRVLKANGGLGCYAGGQAHKRFLLRLEGVPLQE
ncbi:MAG TPA: methylated-DNA--[protein]-cysteine S-methyltransferase, partial [Firmicutes bacterium]|nr:methylated-DNA--[protein]-cysteine S-methyltransferase [Bacillota bacterium]